MTRFNMVLRGASISALVALCSVPALADGKGDRAQQAIAAAQAKIDAAGSMGATANTPAMLARAKAQLALAQENASAGHKETSIRNAIEAQKLADTAIGEAKRAQTDAVTQQAAAADAQVQATQQDAQAQVDAANARASNAAASAQQADIRAAAAQENLDAMRSQPAAVTTTTTTEKHVTSHPATHHVVRRVVRHPATSTATEKTTTTVSTTSPQ